MKFKIKKNELLDSLQIISKAVDPRATLPVLGNILMEIKDGVLIMKATNLEITIKSEQKIEAGEDGLFTIPAKLFLNYVNLIKDEDIEVEEKENLTLFLKTKNSNTEIKGLPAGDFPVFPEFKKEKGYRIPSDVLALAIGQTVFASSWDINRPVLNSILFKKDKNTLFIVATDSYRLAERKIDLIDKSSDSFNFLLPAKAALDLMSVFSKSEEFCEIEVNKNQILFKNSNIEFTSRLQEGNFPEYTSIIPDSYKSRIKIDRDDFNLALKKAALFSEESSHNVKISLKKDGEMFINTNQTEFGKDEISIIGEFEGDEVEIALNANYLMDSLASIKEDKVYFEVTDHTRPGVIRLVDKKDYVYIIMPLKIN